MNAIDRHVGMRMRLRRSMLGLSQDSLAMLLGCNEARITDMEDGTCRVSAAELFALARTLRVPIKWFYE